MFGTIRKHSTWLWLVVAGLTIFSFVVFMGQGGARYAGGHGGLGTIYGKPVTAEQLEAAKREFFIYYWHQTGEFPDRSPNFSATDIQRESYVRVLLARKANAFGIHVSPDSQVTAANGFLASLSRDRSKPVPMSMFIEKVLQPEGLTVADFQRFIVDDLTLQQLIDSLGLPGALITPQEAGQLYDHDHQEFSAQAVFFSATNYFSRVQTPPLAVAQFYTNYMAYYRLPDRISVNYVKYDLSNAIASAEQKLGTNLQVQVESLYTERGQELAPDAKTPAEAKARIREIILRQAGTKAATDQAMQLVTPLFAMDPPLKENLVTLAKKQGLTVYTTAPFSETEGPFEFPSSPDLTKAMFKLNADSPFIPKAITGPDAVYIIGLNQSIPSEIQPLSLIRDRVVEDFRNYQAVMQARSAGSNFYYNAAVQMAAGKTFAQAAIAAGDAPVALTPFSLSSTNIPEAGEHADVRQIQGVAYGTQVGHLSQFAPTSEGGFILCVKSMLPVDQAEKNVELPKFLAQIRRSRQLEAFNIWLETEANRELANTPIAQELMARKAPAGSP